MSIENWGLLTKSQDDSETIEDAINRIVADHEGEPNAHLGLGESLETHRQNEVIDHPAGSVLADKTTNRELVWTSNLADILRWERGDCYSDEFPGATIPETGGSSSTAYMYLNMYGMLTTTIPLNGDYFWQGFIRVAQPTSGITGRLGFGATNGNISDGFGFRFDGSSCYGYFKLGDGLNEVSLVSNALVGYHILRAQFVYDEQAVHFFIDGVDVGSVNAPDETPVSQPYFGFWVKNSVDEAGAITVYNVNVTRYF